MKHNNAAISKWNKSLVSYDNYQIYIKQKRERFDLKLIDLLYISNFKGGNSTINEKEISVNQKLISYSILLKAIEDAFNLKELSQLSNEEIMELISKVNIICNLTHKDTNTKIDGFSVSYLSALLSSYFPNLIPILDRRVLMNLNLVVKDDIDGARQIKTNTIQTFYPLLILEIAKRSKNQQKTIREIDKELFIIRLPEWARPKKNKE